MGVALEEGRKALPDCRPNPPIGCVLVRGGTIVARGFTGPPYHDHAEPMALKQLHGSLEDVVAFVTLEPCSFHNRTPSCARELIERGIKKVFIAMRDPHPRNRGTGVQIMRDAGVEVIEDLLNAEARNDLAHLVWQEGDPS